MKHRRGPDGKLVASASPFLDGIGRLDDDAMAGVLLPKLDHTDVTNLALTCTSLRQLVHCSLGRVLNFRRLAYGWGLHHIRDWTASLPAHFPSCHEVQLRIAHGSSYNVVKQLMPALSGLPQLSHISLDITCRTVAAPLVSQLEAFSRQLKALRGLSLDCTAMWVAFAPAASPWQQLGNMIQLTQLDICLRGAVDMGDLCGLPNLGALQHLLQLGLTVADSVDAAPTEGPEGWDLHFLGQLTALETLRLRLPTADGLSSISSCCRLSQLNVAAMRNRPQALRSAECGAISYLTHLTALHLGWEVEADAVPVLHSALQQLKQLQYVGLNMWTPEVLPVFAQLTRLRTIQGAWPWLQGQQDLNTTALDSCPHVQTLITSTDVPAGTAVPFCAFPNLISCSLCGSVPPSALTSLALQCPSLQCLSTAAAAAAASPKVQRHIDMIHGWCTLQQGAPLDERVAAIHSLGRLSALTALALSVFDDAEVAALVASARNVSQLTVLVPPGGWGHPAGDAKVTHCSLVQLGRLLNLQHLQLELFGISPLGGASMLLCGLCDVTRVSIAAIPTVVDAFTSALAWASEAGLSVPRVEFEVVGVAPQALHPSVLPFAEYDYDPLYDGPSDDGDWLLESSVEGEGEGYGGGCSEPWGEWADDVLPWLNNDGSAYGSGDWESVDDAGVDQGWG